MAEVDLSDIDRRMDGALSALQKEFSGLRTGRASPSLLEPVVVDAYGSKMPLNQVAAINEPDARLLTVQVWDSGLVNSVEKSMTLICWGATVNLAWNVASGVDHRH